MRRILGVDLRDKTLGLTIIESRFRIARPSRSEELVLPEGKDERDSSILEAFKRWKAEYSPDGIVLGIPSQRFSYQVIDMPVMSRDDLRKALLFELEKYLPLSVDEYLFDFLTTVREGETVRVIVLSVKKDLINELLNYAKAADLKVLAIRCSTMEAVGSFLGSAGKKHVNGVFVNITEDSVEVVGLENSKPVFFRDFPGDIDLAYELQKLNPVVVYFNGEPESALAEKFNMRISRVLGSEALAFSEVKHSSLKLNFMPSEYIREAPDYYPYIIGGLSVAAVLIFLFTGIVVYYKDLSALNSIEEKIETIKSKASGVIEAHKKLSSLQSDRKILLDFQHSSNMATKVLGELSKVLPRDAWLITLSIQDKGKVEIIGFAKNVSDIIIALETSGFFRNVAFSSPIITRSGEKRFAVKMEVEVP